MTKSIQAIRGMNDILPGESARWQTLHEACAEVFAAYGYREIKLPLVERTELFKRSIGDVTDIVEKEMYAFEDRGGDSVALRPEGTAGCVRAGIEHGLFHHQTQRLWYSGPMFRYERPQKGRYRQFHQYGVEAFGLGGPDIDAEILLMSARLWKRLGLRDIQLQLNSLGTVESRKAYREKLVTYFNQHQTALDEDSKRRLLSNPLRILDSKSPALAELIAGAPKLVEHLDAESAAHFAGLRALLDSAGLNYVINSRVVRGLDYYTHTVFEWTTQELGSQDAVCSGGRFDGLVQQLGGPPSPAVGFALGVERLIALMELQQAPLNSDLPQVYFVLAGAEPERAGLKLAEELRDALPGLRLLINAGSGGFKAQLKRADKSGAEYALVLGDEELAKRCVQIKSLRVDGTQEAVAWNELANVLGRRLGLN
ncbi:MAG: histidine--tRNA ligase [Nevskiales bacterium]